MNFAFNSISKVIFQGLLKSPKFYKTFRGSNNDRTTFVINK